MAFVSDTLLDELFNVASVHNMFNNIAMEQNILLQENFQLKMVQQTYINFFAVVQYLMGLRGTLTTCLNQHGASRSYSFGQI
jgi:hypothetical protein